VLLLSKIKSVLKAEGISEEELERMLARSAICSDDGANRRFHNWLFEVESWPGRVRRMWKANPRYVGVDKNKGYMAEPHDLCDGEGCVVCGWSGEVRRYINQ